MRAEHDGPVVIAQDLTAFTITEAAVVARQATVDPLAWPVVGPTEITGPPMTAGTRHRGGQVPSSPTEHPVQEP